MLLGITNQRFKTRRNKLKSLEQLQKEVGDWSLANFGNQTSMVTGTPLGSLAPLLGATEELGELCHCVLKHHQGIRGFGDDTKYQEARDDAIGDLGIYLLDFCAREGVSLAEVINRTWDKVCQRNWVANPTNADQILADAKDINDKAKLASGTGGVGQSKEDDGDGGQYLSKPAWNALMEAIKWRCGTESLYQPFSQIRSFIAAFNEFVNALEKQTGKSYEQHT